MVFISSYWKELGKYFVKKYVFHNFCVIGVFAPQIILGSCIGMPQFPHVLRLPACFAEKPEATPPVSHHLRCAWVHVSRIVFTCDVCMPQVPQRTGARSRTEQPYPTLTIGYHLCVLRILETGVLLTALICMPELPLI